MVRRIPLALAVFPLWDTPVPKVRATMLLVSVVVCYTFGLSIRLPYADLFGLPIHLSILIHSPGVVAVTVLLH